MNHVDNVIHTTKIALAAHVKQLQMDLDYLRGAIEKDDGKAFNVNFHHKTIQETVEGITTLSTKIVQDYHKLLTWEEVKMMMI
jgi:hypothetical protein